MWPWMNSRRGFHIARGGRAGRPAGEMCRQTTGNRGTQSYGTKAFGEDRMTPEAMFAGLQLSKPPETAGRKATGG